MGSELSDDPLVGTQQTLRIGHAATLALRQAPGFGHQASTSGFRFPDTGPKDEDATPETGNGKRPQAPDARNPEGVSVPKHIHPLGVLDGRPGPLRVRRARQGSHLAAVSPGTRRRSGNCLVRSRAEARFRTWLPFAEASGRRATRLRPKPSPYGKCRFFPRAEARVLIRPPRTPCEAVGVALRRALLPVGRDAARRQLGRHRCHTRQCDSGPSRARASALRSEASGFPFASRSGSASRGLPRSANANVRERPGVRKLK